MQCSTCDSLCRRSSRSPTMLSIFLVLHVRLVYTCAHTCYIARLLIDYRTHVARPSLVPRPFEGEGKNGLVYTVDACALFPQKHGYSCTFENPPLYVRISSFSLARNTAATRLLCRTSTVLYYTTFFQCSLMPALNVVNLGG